ncbi:MAG: phosphatase PAP2 family protein [Chloroflexi bacterium]|nr:MAG: phosphatase PAP2 family protein [Chloroflexota bacterium]
MGLTGLTHHHRRPPGLDLRVHTARSPHVIPERGGARGYRPAGRYGSRMESVATPPQILPRSVDRRLFQAIHGLPHSPRSDHYISLVSDLGEGLGWVAAGVGVAWLGGQRGRRAGIATALASLGTTYLVQRMVKPIFRRRRPFVSREVMVVGIRTADASFPSGHTASSFAAATALSTFYPNAAPLVFTLATLVGASRVHLGHHFPSDVTAGAVIGIGMGTFTAWLLKLPKFL